MKFKELAKIIFSDYICVYIKENDSCRSIYESKIGLCEKFVKQYGEYKVDSVDIDNFTPPGESLKHGVLDIYLKDNEDED